MNMIESQSAERNLKRGEGMVKRRRREPSWGADPGGRGVVSGKFLRHRILAAFLNFA